MRFFVSCQKLEAPEVCQALVVFISVQKKFLSDYYCKLGKKREIGISLKYHFYVSSINLKCEIDLATTIMKCAVSGNVRKKEGFAELSIE